MDEMTDRIMSELNITRSYSLENINQWFNWEIDISEELNVVDLNLDDQVCKLKEMVNKIKDYPQELDHP